MTKIRFDAKAQKLAHTTGLDKLGQSTLKQIDADNDGVVRLKDAKALVEAAGLEKDGVLGRDDRARIQAVLGETGGTKAPRARGPGADGVLNARLSSASRASAKLANGYVEHHTRRVPDGLQVKLTFTPDDKRGRPQPDEAMTRTMVLHGLDPRSVSVQAFGPKGETGFPSSGGALQSRPGSEGASPGAGLLVAVADRARGVVVVDVVAKDFVAGAAPEQRTLLSPAKLAKNHAIKAEAERRGLDAKSLSVEVRRIRLSDGHDATNTLTVALDVKLSDASGKSRKAELSGYLEGNLKKGLADLKISDLELGVSHRGGNLYPPSSPHAHVGDARLDDGSSTSVGFDHDWNGGTGGGESSAGSYPYTGDSRSNNYGWGSSIGGGE